MLENEQSLVKEIAKLLILKNKTLSVTESCTGGKISSILTSFSGSSNFFKGGIIAYSKQVKINQLRVRQKDLERYSAVSEQVAIQMVEEVKKQFQSDYAIATTGYAGPEGKKVGQVFIAFSSEERVLTLSCFFEGKRKEIINKASVKALSMLLSEIKK